MSKSRRFRRYQVKPYQEKALQALKPPEDILVSEWAEKYRILDSKSSNLPGPWNNEKTPYLVGIMDELLSYETEEIIFVKPTQVGGTEAMLNMLGYVIQQDPSSTMLVYPSDELGQSIVVNRIHPMLRAAPELARRWHETESSKMELQFDGMYLNVVGSNSPSKLASKAMRFLFLDEVDKFLGATAKEADPISLAKERTKTFRTNRKIFMTSTPTLKTGHIWKAMESADEVRHYFVPCPHCGKFIELEWKQVKFPDEKDMTIADRAEFAFYVCQECDAIITDRDKPKMLRYGEWRTVEKRAGVAKKVAFWINTLYSPFVRLAEMVKAWLSTQGDPDALQNFINSWFAEPWEDTKLKTSADTVMERQTELEEFMVPKWARILTGGVDVQENCVYWTIRAWGNYYTSQNISHGQALGFAEVEEVMNLQYLKEDGTPMIVSLAIVDSGNDTDRVYDFCARNAEWALPGKGASHEMDQHYRKSPINKIGSKAYGMELVLIDTGKFKDQIASRMRRENGSGSWMVYKGCDREYAEMVTSEHKVNVKSGQRTVQRWVTKTTHADNHYLDCEVYAMCAAEMLGVRWFHLEQVQREPAQQPEQPVNSVYTPEENWIGENEGWLGG